MHLLTKEMILLNADVETWQQAVVIGGELLLKNNYIQQCYIDAMINNMRENGPYFVLSPGVAMPHADSRSGVEKTGISLVTLASPINFLETPNNPVQLVICLAASNNESHLELLKRIANLLMNPKKVQQIINEKAPEEILRIFNT